MKINPSDILVYLFLIAGVISYVASVMKNADKKHAQLWIDVQNVADAVVAQQSISDKSGAEKKATATNDLIKQVDQLGHNKITETVAKGAIKQAVNKLKTQNELDSPLDDLHI